jgi:HlyD family secretion protein
MLQKSPKPEVSPVAPAVPDIAAVLKAGAPTRKLRRYVIAGVVVIVAAVGAWMTFGGSTKSSAVTYMTTAVARGDLTVGVTATGTVQPTNEVEISSELSGTVATVDVDFNDRVKKGQTLATLDPDNLNAAVALNVATLRARQADVTQAQATVDETASAYARALQLGAKGLATEETMDGAKAAANRATAGLVSANANLDIATANASIARSDLSKATIVSPVDGVVLSRAIEVGQTVASSLQAPVLFTLAEDLTKMQLEVDIDEADVGKVSQGNAANFTVEAYTGRKFPATITQIRYSPATVEGVVTYKAILTVDNTDLLLRPGMTATAEIIVEQVKDALLVSNAALRYAPPVVQQSTQRTGGLLGLLLPSGGPGGNRTGQTTVTAAADGTRTLYLLRDGAPVAVTVKVGVTDGTHTEIVSGDLKEGDLVITGSKTAS